MIPLADQHKVTYFKRFKMEVDLHEVPPVPPLTDGYRWIAWENSLLDVHAEVMFRSFQSEVDALVFPSLGDRIGSSVLMQEIRSKSGFLPQATWLLASAAGYCGCIQGLWERSRLGAIQNLAVTPGHRGRDSNQRPRSGLGGGGPIPPRLSPGPGPASPRWKI